MAKIIVVEDDEIVREGLQTNLSTAGYSVMACTNIAEFEKIGTGGISLVIMDWELPDGEGIDAVKRMRQKGDTTPVIILTARTDVVDKVVGFEIGANDYVTKPFEVRELIARIRNQIRGPQAEIKMLTQGDIQIDLSAFQITYKNQVLQVTKMEFQLLKFFMENAGRALARDEILNEVWGFDNFPSTRTVDVHVTMLRQKIGEDYIETLRGIGYRFKAK